LKPHKEPRQVSKHNTYEYTIMCFLKCKGNLKYKKKFALESKEILKFYVRQE
jgi:hypothetical protein